MAVRPKTQNNSMKRRKNMLENKGVSRRKFMAMAGATAGVSAIPFASSALAASPDDPPAIAEDAYIWGFPLVLVQRYWDIGREKQIPINRFTGKQHLSRPSDKIVGPNIDTLYGYSWLDLTKEPQLLYVPDTNDRYYSIQLLDEYANTFAYVGRRATGTKEGVFALVGPDWNGTLPAGVERIYSPTNIGIAFTRTLVQGDADLPAAQAIQRQYALSPLSSYPNVHASGDLADAELSLFPILQLDKLGVEFFDRLSAGLVAAPPPNEDSPYVSRFAKVGIVPGAQPSRSQNPAVVSALRDSVPVAADRIRKADFSTNVNGWTTNYKVTNFIKDPLLRAAVNQYGPATHIAQEALYFSAKSNGQVLSGENKYVLKFPSGQLPPVDAFWSLTLYGQNFFLVENQINRYAIGDRTAGLAHGSDGSLEIQVQAEPPASGTSNWLPSPSSGPFQLVLRTYQPRPALFNGSYKIPPLQKV
jgi:hypothetical protein